MLGGHTTKELEPVSRHYIRVGLIVVIIKPMDKSGALFLRRLILCFKCDYLCPNTSKIPCHNYATEVS